jgi:glycosyltransferase involved in cell wall biosynthesis
VAGASVVIPTYNRRERVGQAVASVLAQTMGDFEVIVVDDGSDDGTGESLARLDPRVRVHRQAKRGPAAARNAAIRLARGPVVSFLDADNRWLPDHLEVLVALLARFPEAVLASTCPAFKVAGGAPVDEARLIDPLPAALLNNKFGYVSCTAVRRAVLLEVGGFDERMAVGEDDDLWLRLAIKGPFAMLQRRTIVRRHTRGGLRDRGRRRGTYTEANRQSLAGVVEQLERRPGPDTAELVARARARLQILAAVEALERREQGAARSALVQACALLPKLERDPEPIMTQLWKSAHGSAELRLRVEGAATAMPDPGCHSTLYMRACAAGMYLSRGRLVRAARLVLRRPHLIRRGFLSKARRPLYQTAKSRLVEIAQSTRESPLAGG